MAAHLAFHLGEYAFALRQCQKAFENKASVPAVQQEDLLVDTVQDFLLELGMKPQMYLVKSSFFHNIMSSPDLKVRKSWKQFMVLPKNEQKKWKNSA